MQSASPGLLKRCETGSAAASTHSTMHSVYLASGVGVWSLIARLAWVRSLMPTENETRTGRK
jgi:hypothetical protein